MLKSKVRELMNKTKNNSFIKSILTLSAGVVISQSFALITTPIVSRIYGPEVIGDFSIITSSATIIGTVICFGLMTAIMIPKEESQAKALCRLLLLLVTSMSTVLFIISITISKVWQMFSVSLDYRIACLILWLFVNLTNIVSICYAYINRKKMYKVLFWNPTLGTVTNAVVSIILGLLHYGLWGYACGNILAAVVLIVHMLLRANPFIGKIEGGFHPFKLLKEYKNFVLYQFPANLIGTVSHQIPVQMIKYYFGSAILGSYAMCLMILSIPSKFLAAPVNRVYYREATERYNNGQSIGTFSYKILEANIKLAIIPISFIIIFGKPLFSLVLGAQWEQAGSFSSILGVYQLVLFSSSCLSGNYVIIGKQHVNLIFSIVSIVLNLTALGVGFYVFGNIYLVLIFFAIVGTCYKLVDLGLFFYYTEISPLKFLCFVVRYIVVPATVSLAVKFGLEWSGVL